MLEEIEVIGSWIVTCNVTVKKMNQSYMKKETNSGNKHHIFRFIDMWFCILCDFLIN